MPQEPPRNLTGHSIKRNLALVAPLTDHFNPLTGKTVKGEHVTDVQGAKFTRPQPGVDREENESLVSRAKRLARADGREQLLLLGG